MISTSKRRAEHLFARQNSQQISKETLSDIFNEIDWNKVRVRKEGRWERFACELLRDINRPNDVINIVLYLTEY